MSEPVHFTLDDREVEAAAGETLWQVAERQGTVIPHLCYDPQPGYRPDGNCRACMVEVEGERVLAASCIPASDPRHEGEHGQRTGPERAPDGAGVVDGGSAPAGGRPRFPFAAVALGRADEGDGQPVPGPRRPRSRH